MLFLLILFSCRGATFAADTAPRASESPLTEKAALQRYSLDDLDAAAGFLVEAVDSDNPRENCGFTSEKARKYLQAIHPLIDRKTDLWIEAARKRRSEGSLISKAELQSCQKECHCGIYASVLERAGHLSSRDQSAMLILTEKAKGTSPRILNGCALRAKRRFCGGPLMRYLEGEVARNY